MSKDIKDISTENKKVQSSKKSSYSKKKKSKKVITSGIAYEQSTFNNKIVSIAFFYTHLTLPTILLV